MFQFNNFPVYVIYSRHRQQSVGPLWNRYYNEMDYTRRNLFRGNILRNINKIAENNRLIEAVQEWEIIEDLRPKYDGEINNYENEIRKLLTTISTIKIGQLILNSLNKGVKTWILPFPNDGIYNAITWLASESEGGGVRIRFNPKDFNNAYVSEGVSYDARDETLLHELVHASRYSNGKFGHKPLISKDFLTSEEFLATQLENIYFSSRRRQKFYSLYRGGYGTKDEVYKILTEDAELIMLLKHFLQTEPLAKQAATLITPHYNPFRDFKELEKNSLKHFGMDSFSDF